MRMKRPAAINIGVDLDREALGAFLDLAPPELAMKAFIAGTGERALPPELTMPAGIVKNDDKGLIDEHDDAAGVALICGDAFDFLTSYPFTGRELIYSDPPYLHATRSRDNYYRHELTVDEHVRLLDLLKTLPCMVMISGYESQLYADALAGWNATRFESMTRGGRMATEWLWYNYPTPIALHDYSFLGENFRERERIKRKKQRWVNRLRTMPMLERRALLAALREAWLELDLASSVVAMAQKA